MKRYKGPTHYIKYKKVIGGYKAEGFTRTFKTASALKNHFTRTSHIRVKFIKI